jgi:hypothetical protein
MRGKKLMEQYVNGKQFRKFCLQSQCQVAIMQLTFARKFRQLVHACAFVDVPEQLIVTISISSYRLPFLVYACRKGR